jgi:hypothetical protein
MEPRLKLEHGIAEYFLAGGKGSEEYPAYEHEGKDNPSDYQDIGRDKSDLCMMVE